MNEVFLTSRTNLKTCSLNGILLHSGYDPQKEAQRFVQTIATKIDPLFVIVTGPALSYCVPYLRTRFPAAKLAAVQYSRAFSATDCLWDTLFFSGDGNVGEKLYDLIGEENWGGALFVSWKPSESAWPREFEKTWQEIRDASVKCRNVLATRSYFNRRWMTNRVRFCLELDQSALLAAGDEPIVIAASGPSLADSLASLKKYRNAFFLLALSSAVPPLARAGVEPDLIITTDGGYWAKTHLQELERLFPRTPVAAPFEAALPARLMAARTIIPLSYEDEADVCFTRLCGMATVKAERNGTVSGTAAELALRLTSGGIFFCGLDLAPNPAGFAHTQPNALETSKATGDARLYPAETRQAAQAGANTALDIYASWFSSRNDYFNSRVFRLQGKKPPARNLSPLRDVSWETIAAAAAGGTKKIRLSSTCCKTKSERRAALAAYFSSCLERMMAETEKPAATLTPETAFWLKTAHLGLYLQYRRGNAAVLEKLLAEGRALLADLRELIDRHE